MNKKLKIALMGYGRMGKLVEEAAIKRGHQVVAKLNSSSDILPVHVDVCIDFSKPSAVVENAKKATKQKANLVIGTTDWNEHHAIQELVEKANVACVHSPNFLIGMQLFLQIVQDAAKLLAPYYDVGGYELHHAGKKDAPSGTAKAIVEKLLTSYKNKKPLFELGNREKKEDELHFSSVRLGSIFGTHSVLFDSSVDTITLTHASKSRSGFAEGAVVAAEMIQNKKGYYTLGDIL